MRKQQQQRDAADIGAIRFIGRWSLPSGNSVDVYLTLGGVELFWDVPPSRGWPVADVRHWKRTTFPAIAARVGTAVGQPVLCVWDAAAVH